MASETENAAPRQSGPGRSIGTFLVLALLVLAAAFLFGKYFAAPSGGAGHPAVGQPLALGGIAPLTSGAQPLRPSELQGKVLLVNFWGYWCPPCRKEFPHLMELEESLRAEKDFRLISVACDPGNGDDEAILRKETDAFLAAHASSLPVYFDPQQTARSTVAEVVGHTGFAYPTTVILDRQGIIRGLWIGFDLKDADEMRRVIREALAQ